MATATDESQKHAKDAQQGFEACAASVAALTKGFQTIASESADFSRRSLENGAAVVEKFIAAKSLDKVVEVQQIYIREAYEATLTQMNKLGELYMSTTKEAYKPFESQLSQFWGRFTNGK